MRYHELEKTIEVCGINFCNKDGDLYIYLDGMNDEEVCLDDNIEDVLHIEDGKNTSLREWFNDNGVDIEKFLEVD